MIEYSYDATSINSFANSYHKISKAGRINAVQKMQLPPSNGHLFIKASLHTSPLRDLMK
jgi:hypothetical protein